VAEKLFAACDRGELTLVVLPEVLAECVFVLESFYKQPRDLIARALGTLVGSPGIEISDAHVRRQALDLYARTRLHFVDCTLAAAAADAGRPIASFDAGLGKLPGVRIAVDI